MALGSIPLRSCLARGADPSPRRPRNAAFFPSFSRQAPTNGPIAHFAFPPRKKLLRASSIYLASATETRDTPLTSRLGCQLTASFEASDRAPSVGFACGPCRTLATRLLCVNPQRRVINPCSFSRNIHQVPIPVPCDPHFTRPNRKHLVRPTPFSLFLSLFLHVVLCPIPPDARSSSANKATTNIAPHKTSTSPPGRSTVKNPEQWRRQKSSSPSVT